MPGDFLTTLSRRQALALLGMPMATSLAAPTWATVGTPLPLITLAGPNAIVSAPLIHMVESNALQGVAQRTVFASWRDPDQLRMMAMGGKADVLAMPSNVAANLFNRGAGVTLLNISTWGSQWMITRDAQRKALADFKGEEIAVPFRGDMPDIVLQLLAAKQGMDSQRDFRIRYVPTPMEAMQLLITHRVSHALLSEPAISLALRKTRSLPAGIGAPELHRTVDMQQEWGRLFQRAPRIPQAGIAAVGGVRAQPQLLAAVVQAYAKSLDWCRSNAMECGRMMARYIDLLTPEAAADSIAVSQMEAVQASAARAELEFFYGQLMTRNPQLVGGKLPEANFYHPAAQPLATISSSQSGT